MSKSMYELHSKRIVKIGNYNQLDWKRKNTDFYPIYQKLWIHNLKVKPHKTSTYLNQDNIYEDASLLNWTKY